MEIKILYVCIGISSILGLFLGFYIMIYKPVCERYHVDEIYRNIDGVNCEEWAAEIAAACLKIEYDFESQEAPDYDVEVVFNELSYEWIVIFTPKESEQDEVKMVAIRKDFGTVDILSGGDSTSVTDTVEICVAGFTMKYVPQNRKLTIEDFQSIELEDSLQDIEEKIGKADGWIGSGILHPVYVLEDGRTVVCYFSYPQVCKDLRELTIYDGNEINFVLKKYEE